MKFIIPILLILSITAPLAAADGRVYFIRSASFSEVVVSKAYTRLLERSFHRAYSDPKMKALILEIDTPGGRIDAALTIKDMILKYTKNDKRPAIAYVNTHAISAGALIALSCPILTMAPSGTIGDAAPVSQHKGKMVRLGEKIVSPIRAVFKALGERYNRAPEVLTAMVDSDIILTREKHGISKKKGKLLTLTARSARRLKICDFIAKTKGSLLKKYALSRAEVVYLDYNDSDRIISFLTTPFLSWLLMTLGIVGLIFEVKTPGWGVGGTIGILCLAAFFTSRVMLTPGTWVAPVLFVIGAILLLVEIFIIPGFGLVGIAGTGMMILSLLMALGISNLRQSATLLALSILSSGLFTALLFKLVPKTRTFKKIVLFDSGKGFHSPTDHDNAPKLTGKSGRAYTNLRPAGTIEIEKHKYDAVSDGGFIDAGSRITVVAAQGMRLVVTKATGKSKT